MSREAGAAVGQGGAAEMLRAMETYKNTKKFLPIMLTSVQEQC